MQGSIRYDKLNFLDCCKFATIAGLLEHAVVSSPLSAHYYSIRVQFIASDDKLDDVGIFPLVCSHLRGHVTTAGIQRVARSIAWPIAPFNCAALSTGSPFSLDGLQQRVTQSSVNHHRDRIPRKPAMPFQPTCWSLYARAALGKQFHV